MKDWGCHNPTAAFIYLLVPFRSLARPQRHKIGISLNRKVENFLIVDCVSSVESTICKYFSVRNDKVTMCICIKVLGAV